MSACGSWVREMNQICGVNERWKIMEARRYREREAC